MVSDHSMEIFSKKKGLIALLTVIIIGAIVLSIGLAAAFIGNTAIIVAGHADREYSTRMLASACVEEAMHRLKLDSGFTSGTIPIGSDTCVISMSGSGSNRTITLTATSGQYTKTITIGGLLKQNVAANARAWTVDSWVEGDPP